MLKEKLIELFSKEKIVRLIVRPQESPKEALLLLGIFLVAIFIILILIAIFFLKSPQEERKIPKKRKGKGHLKRWLLIAAGILGLTLVLSATMTLVYTSQPSFCNSCHVMKKDYRTWKMSSHRGVGCLACHDEPGAIGFLVGKAKLVRETISYVRNSYDKPIISEVTNKSCLRCHRKIEKKVTAANAIRVSHQEFLKEGYKCTDCHNTVAHGKAVPQKKYPHMDDCLTCHNDNITSAECKTCHPQDVAKRPEQKRDFPKVHLEEITNCKGCHPIEKCTRCHGVEMPHPPGWVRQRLHAPQAAFEKKEICRKCHLQEKFCSKCHDFPGHIAGWRLIHGLGGVESEENCTFCHKTRPWCKLCHQAR